MNINITDELRHSLVGWPSERMGNPSGFLADREHQAHAVERAMELTGLAERLATPESAAEWIDSASNEEIDNTLITLNGLLLNLPRDRWGLADRLQYSNDGAGHIETVYPAPEDKVDLLHLLYGQIRVVPEPKDKALLAAIGLNALHPFLEGNGRVARLTYHIMTHGYQKGDPLILRLLSEEGDEILLPNPSSMDTSLTSLVLGKIGSHTTAADGVTSIPHIPVMGTETDGHVVGKMAYNPRLSELDVERLFLIYNDPHFTEAAIYLAIMDVKAGVSYIPPLERGKTNVFDLDAYSLAATSEEISELYDIFSSIKKLYFQVQLQIFTHPDMFIFQDPDTGEQMPVVEHLRLVTENPSNYPTTT